MSNTILKMTDIAKTFASKGKMEEVQALQSINLEVKAGDFVALYGPSGCGKSTLLLTAGGLLKPDTGMVEINSTSIYTMNNSFRASFRVKNVGFVFQQFYLIPYLNVRDNVMISQLATGRDSQAIQKANEILDRFGLTDRLEHHPSELSVGEQQRVALSRAVFAGASILFADEPTGNLDSHNAEIVLTFLKEFSKEGGAVFMVTHEDSVISYASHKLKMDKGSLLTS